MEKTHTGGKTPLIQSDKDHYIYLKQNIVDTLFGSLKYSAVDCLNKDVITDAGRWFACCSKSVFGLV